MIQDISEKLYPPTIEKSIPAFYIENGTANIVVPFSMNRAVGFSQVKSFMLKIKTIQSNEVIAIIESLEVEKAKKSGIIDFLVDDESVFKKIKIGQYLKIQVAYKDFNDVIGYYSTVGIIKYTSKPLLYIDGVQGKQRTLTFKQTYVGVYEPTTDKSERPYSYSFSLYDNNQNLIETSGWLLHNNELSETNNKYTIEKAIDTYTFYSTLEEGSQYLLTYSVKTINNLELTAGPYYCTEMFGGDNSNLNISLHAKNNFEEAYINLFFKGTKENIEEDFLKPVSIKISRTSDKTNYKEWRVIRKEYFSSYRDFLKYSFKDFLIEQGVNYQYAFQQYNDIGFSSEREKSNICYADFEDFFLWDGQKQLKVRFNPKISSFKTTQLEQKMETIGSKYPFFFRNTTVGYKEFPINGLISYLSDNNQLFVDYKADLKLDTLSLIRDGTPSVAEGADIPENIPTTNLLSSNIYAERQFKTILLDWLNNGKAKLFKSPQEGNYLIRLMNSSLTPNDTLGRMLHSFQATAYEIADYTYLSLINLGFIDVTDRKQNTKSFMSEILSEQIFSKLNISSKSFKKYESETKEEYKLRLQELYNQRLSSEQIRILSTPIKINKYDIIDLLKIEILTSGYNKPSYIFRLKEDDLTINKKILVQNGSNLNLYLQGQYEDLYFCFSDNFSISKISSLQDILPYLELLDGIVITYGYKNEDLLVGELKDIEDIYAANKASSLIGPAEKEFFLNSGSKKNHAKQEEDIMKIYSLKFYKKEIVNIYVSNSFSFYDNISVTNTLNYFEDKDLIQNISFFSPIYLYNIISADGLTQKLYFYKDSLVSKNGYLSQIENIDTSIILTSFDDNEEDVLFTEPPSLDLLDNNKIYKKIKIGNGIYSNICYQTKITLFKEVTENENE